MLIINGADPNDFHDFGDLIPTMLHLICFNRNKGTLQAVLESNVPVNIPNNLGRTAIFYAGSPEMVVLLFNAGHSVEWEDNTGFRPLHYMVSHNESIPTIKKLLDLKCDQNAEDQNGRTPLHIICRQDKDPLHHSVEFHDRREELRCRLQTIQLLADYGASFIAKDNEGKTPLDLLWIPPHENDFEEWNLVKEFLREMYDAQYNHGFKRARVIQDPEDEG
jgi:ankyrin repeat protein